MMKSKFIGATFLRVFFGLIILKDLINYSANSKYLFGESSVCSIDNYLSILETFNISFLFIDFSSFSTVIIFFSTSILACIFWLFGFRTVITGGILYFCLMIIRFRCVFMQDGADNVVYIMIPFISLLIGYNLFTGKLINNFKGNTLSIIPKLAGIGVLIQLSFIYFVGAISKMSNPYWYNGEALYYVLRVEDFVTSFLNVELTKSSFFVKFTTYFTLLWELSFGLMIWWSKKLRIFYIVTGLLLHLGIWVFMRIDNFSFVMISLYPFLIYDHEFKLIAKWFKKTKLGLTISQNLS